MPIFEREMLLARAIGRALAHELGHYLLASKEHTEERADESAPDRRGILRSGRAAVQARRSAAKPDYGPPVAGSGRRQPLRLDSHILTFPTSGILLRSRVRSFPSTRFPCSYEGCPEGRHCDRAAPREPGDCRAAGAEPGGAAPKVTPPKDQFGFAIGDDYRLVNYTQYVDYLKKLDVQSERMIVADIGKTEEGRTEFTAIITSPENQRKLPLIKEANRKLALAEDLTDEQARQLARDGKIVVWIDGGLHATEVLGAQQLIETIYRLNTKTDPETLRILNDVVILCTLVNPDGMELVSNWYMREADEKQRSTGGIPRLYQKYIGHDDNRDFYMMNMSESVNANKMMYREWFPAIMYNHHQTGPAGAVLFAPPFRDPFNYNFDPLDRRSASTWSAPAIHTRLAAEGKPGAVMRTGAPYSTWFNGGIRTTSYFHNQIGILTETIGNPTPVEIPFVLDMQLPRADVPNPIAPRTFHFRDSDRVLGDQQLRDPRHRVEAARRLPLQHVQDGEERHRQGQPRQLDDPSEADRGGARGDRGGAGRRVARRREHRAARRPRRRRSAAAARRSRSTTTCSTIRRCAIRAASSCRRISPTS